MSPDAVACSSPANAHAQCTCKARAYSPKTGGFVLCMVSITIPRRLGILAKETLSCCRFTPARSNGLLFQISPASSAPSDCGTYPSDLRIIAHVRAVCSANDPGPGLAATAALCNPSYWATRDFSLRTRLLSEARIVVDYMRWTLLPTPNALSFYHDDFHISSGLLTPWTTLASIALLGPCSR